MRYTIFFVGLSIFLLGCSTSPDIFEHPALFNRNAPIPIGIDCFDSDANQGQMDQFIKGFVYTKKEVEYDSCYGSSLRELRCVFGTKQSNNVPCALGCNNGACIRAEKIYEPKPIIPHVKLGWCSDADGDNTSIASSASSSQKTIADSCKKYYANHSATVERCNGPDCYVSEVTCSPDFKLVTSESRCELGCEKGACKKE